MKYILIIYFLSFSYFTVSQDSKLDSIDKVLEARLQRDSIRINTLLEAINFYRYKEFEKSLPYINEALEISKEQNLTIQHGVVLRKLGRYYLNKGMYDKAIENALDALRALEKAQVKDEIILSNSFLARLYRDKGFFEKALEMNKANITLIENNSDSRDKPRYYFDIGNSYLALKQYKNAEKSYKTAIEIAQKINFIPGEMAITLALAKMYKDMDEYDKAKEQLAVVLPYYKENKQLKTEGLVYYHYATISSLEGKHKESIPYYIKSLKVNEQLGSLFFIKNINQKLFIAYNIVGDLKKAKAANVVYKAISDSIDNMETKRLIADVKTKYETEKITTEIILAENRAKLAESESQKNLTLFLSVSVIAILIIISSIFYFLKLKQSKKAELIALQLQESQKRLALEKQYRDSELKALKAQMNPHFIFNVLNSIQEFIILNQKEIASDYLAMFAELIRSYLHFSNQGFISLREETEALEKYLELESLRFGDTFTYRLKIDNDINLDGFNIPTMIIQPYIENAIKHGLFNKKKDRVLNIDFTQQEIGIVKCEITDNGIGREKAQKIKASKTTMHKSFAMEATANRLELYNQKSHKKISLETIDLMDDEQNAMGTKVILIIRSITK